MNNYKMYKSLQTHWGAESNSYGELYPVEDYFLSKYVAVEDNKKILDAGTGGGRIAFNIEKKGAFEIYAYDYVEDFIINAKRVKKKSGSNVLFMVADATNLVDYNSGFFDSASYLQQVISFVEPSKHDVFVREIYRVLADNKCVVVSACLWEGRRLNLLLSLLRLLRREKKKYNELPWMHVNHALNWNFMKKDQATVYWFREKEILSLFERNGFKLIEKKYSSDFGNKEKGMIYLALQKA